MNTAKERAANMKREEQDREVELVAAADRGARDFYKVSGYGKLLAIAASAVALALFAQWKLRHQDYLFGSLAVFAAVFALSLIGSAMPYGVRKRARNEAKSVRRAAARMLRRNRSRISEAAAQEVERGMRGVDEALQGSRTGSAALEARTRLDASLDQHLAFARKSAAREYTESIGGAILVALVLRAFVFEPFH